SVRDDRGKFRIRRSRVNPHESSPLQRIKGDRIKVALKCRWRDLGLRADWSRARRRHEMLTKLLVIKKYFIRERITLQELRLSAEIVCLQCFLLQEISRRPVNRRHVRSDIHHCCGS